MHWWQVLLTICASIGTATAGISVVIFTGARNSRTWLEGIRRMPGDDERCEYSGCYLSVGWHRHADVAYPMPPDSKMIRVWRFDDAPRELRELSRHGGDEDWLALVPPSARGYYIPWLEEGSFGACDVSDTVVQDGYVVRIGAHA